MMASQLGSKRLIRFSIATLLFAMLCLGGYLSGYRVGFDAGEQEGVNQLIASVNRPPYFIKTYAVGDLIVSPAGVATFDGLVDAILLHVAPHDWVENGTGVGEITPFPPNLSLVISQNEANHQAIAALLAQFRQSQRTFAAIDRYNSSP